MPEEETKMKDTTETTDVEVPVEGVDVGGDKDVPVPDEGEMDEDITVDNILEAIFELPQEVQMEIHQKLMASIQGAEGPDFANEEFVEEKQAEMPGIFL